MKDILFETDELLKQQKEKFLGKTTGDLRKILEGVWREKFQYDKTSAVYDTQYNWLQPQLEALGFKCGTGVKYGSPTFYISWKSI